MLYNFLLPQLAIGPNMDKLKVTGLNLGWVLNSNGGYK
jgi:hypothetical protein